MLCWSIGAISKEEGKEESLICHTEMAGESKGEQWHEMWCYWSDVVKKAWGYSKGRIQCVLGAISDTLE